MFNKYFIAAGIIILVGIAVAAYLLLFSGGPDLSKYEFLKEPRITTLPGQKMLEVRVTGDPNIVGKDGFGTLFKIYFQLKRTTSGLPLVAPRTRWPKPLTTPKSEWLGLYGMPLPATVTELPKQDGPVKATIATWEYGEVAEILHVGPYSEEQPAVHRLHAFIANQGYVISGEHEEEYLKGPGMLLQGDPKKYHTIIRYRVQKASR
ncbi:MAG TPA: GyrI-like domain-containing protein [Nitrospirota bacterium]|nr:GyrI-like domain-containing protein [Nitrospirota bacterium]